MRAFWTPSMSVTVLTAQICSCCSLDESFLIVCSSCHQLVSHSHRQPALPTCAAQPAGDCSVVCCPSPPLHCSRPLLPPLVALPPLVLPRALPGLYSTLLDASDTQEVPASTLADRGRTAIRFVQHPSQSPPPSRWAHRCADEARDEVLRLREQALCITLQQRSAYCPRCGWMHRLRAEAPTVAVDGRCCCLRLGSALNWQHQSICSSRGACTHRFSVAEFSGREGGSWGSAWECRVEPNGLESHSAGMVHHIRCGTPHSGAVVPNTAARD